MGSATDIRPVPFWSPAEIDGAIPRAIAHGMWSLARCAALTQDSLKGEPKELLVQFKQPLLLPGKVAVKYNVQDDEVRFALLARNAGRTHLTGTLR